MLLSGYDGIRTGPPKDMRVYLEQEYRNLPAKLKFTWWCACDMHTALVFFNWPLALWARFGIS